jgi:GNAT superfamily N-acetyltransferase
MRIRVRLATLEDIPQIVVLLEKLHGSAGFEKCASFDEESATIFTERLINIPTAEILVADADGKIIGLSSYIVDSPYFNFSKKVASGISFWVDQEYRKSGVGKALYAASEMRAKLLGCEVLTVGVLVQDEYLQSYHERNGFERREVLFHKEIK